MDKFEFTSQNSQDYYRENVGKFVVLHYGYQTSFSLGSFDNLADANKVKKAYNKTVITYKATTYQVYFSDFTCQYGLNIIKR